MKILLIILILLSTLFSKELEKVSIQFQWLEQFQFAGYIVAKERGFYKDVGLDVELKSFKAGLKVCEEVTHGRANFGIGRSSLIIDKSEGSDIRLLNAIFQSSPLIFLTIKKSNIKTIHDFVGKRVMLTPDVNNAISIQAILAKEHLNVSQLKIQTHSFDIESLINGETDIMAAYISNEPFTLKQKNIPFVIFDTKRYGFDFYSDILFTNSYEIKNHKQRTINFMSASIKGWRWAFDNIDATVDLIFEKYNPQHKTKASLKYEAQELKKLAYYGTSQLGHIDINKVQRMYDIYNLLGFVKKSIDLKSFIFHDDSDRFYLTDKEKEYLKSKGKIKYCIDPHWLPFEAFEDKKHIGLSALYFNYFQDKLNTPLEVLYTKTWSQSLEYAKQRKCDMISLAVKTKSRENYLDFTTALVKSKIVIATKLDTSFIIDFKKVNGKKIGIPKNYAFKEILKEKYPNFKLVETETLEDAMNAVRDSKIYGVIGTLDTLEYLINKKFYKELKINGNLNELFLVPIATRNDEPILKDIFQKLINSLNQEQISKINNKNKLLMLHEYVDYTKFYNIGIAFIILLMILGYKIHLTSVHNKELRKQKDKLQTTQDNFILGQKIAGVGIWTLDYKNNVLLWSDGVHMIFGTNPDTFDETLDTFISFIAKEDKERVLQAYESAIENKTDYFIEHKIVTLKGEVKYVEEICQNIFDDDGEIFRSIGTVLDITRRKAVEMELENLNKHLEERVAEELEKNKEKQKQLIHHSRMAQMGELLSMIAHQWRQPLGAISATTASIKVKLELESFDFSSQEGIDQANEFFMQNLNKINSYVQNLSATIDDFRNFYKADKDSSFESLKNVVEKSLNIIEPSLNKHNIKISKTILSDKEIDLYDSEIMQVILNILTNAQDKLNDEKLENPEINIVVKENEIEISDNGAFIDDEIIDKIFDPYFSTKDKQNGTGIGLYMSKIIIEEHHNGQLLVQNTKDGVSFRIKLHKGGGKLQ
jgi:polar amino acid transport system substrate-binding protein